MERRIAGFPAGMLLILSKKPSAGVSRPQARNKFRSFFSRRVREKNTFHGASVELYAKGVPRGAERSEDPLKKVAKPLF